MDSLAGGLAAVRTGLFRARAIQRHELVLDLCGSSGLLTWEAVRQVPEGGVYSLVNSPQDGEKLLEQAHNLPQLRRPQVVVATVDTLDQAIDPSLHFEFAVGRNVLGTSDRHAARIKAIIRRNNKKSGGAKRQASNVVTEGDLKLDRESRRVFIKDKEINLTAKEFDLLELLVTNPNKVYSRETLLEYVWGNKAMVNGDVRTVDVHVRRLREKIEPSPSDPKYVHTKWGVGYFFRA